MVIGKNFIFIHVPKTAGNSIIKAINPEKVYKPNHQPFFQVSDSLKAEKFSFGFVRNPWDRVCSLYHFRVQSGIDARKKEIDRLVSDGFEKSVLNWTIGPNKQDAMYWLDGCDFIGRFESLQSDFNQICRMIGYPEIQLQVENKSNHSDYRDYYTRDMIDVVAEKHRQTIELFDYTF